MKRILIALMVAFTFYSLAFAESGKTIPRDSTEVVKTEQQAKEKVSYSDETDTIFNGDEELFEEGDAGIHLKMFDEKTISNGIKTGTLISIISIIFIFGMPIAIILIVYYFRYKNKKAKYRVIEQAIASGQPIPDYLVDNSNNNPTNSKSMNTHKQVSDGIKTTFKGIGLFVFLWAITGSFGVGSVGLLVMFIGIGQWVTASVCEKKEEQNATFHENRKDNSSEEVEEVEG